MQSSILSVAQSVNTSKERPANSDQHGERELQPRSGAKELVDWLMSLESPTGEEKQWNSAANVHVGSNGDSNGDSTVVNSFEAFLGGLKKSQDKTLAQTNEAIHKTQDMHSQNETLLSRNSREFQLNQNECQMKIGEMKAQIKQARDFINDFETQLDEEAGNALNELQKLDETLTRERELMERLNDVSSSEHQRLESDLKQLHEVVHEQLEGEVRSVKCLHTQLLDGFATKLGELTDGLAKLEVGEDNGPNVIHSAESANHDGVHSGAHAGGPSPKSSGAGDVNAAFGGNNALTAPRLPLRTAIPSTSQVPTSMLVPPSDSAAPLYAGVGALGAQLGAKNVSIQPPLLRPQSLSKDSKLNQPLPADYASMCLRTAAKSLAVPKLVPPAILGPHGKSNPMNPSTRWRNLETLQQRHRQVEMNAREVGEHEEKAKQELVSQAGFLKSQAIQGKN